MLPYQIALKSLSGIQISPDNKYVRELEQALEGATQDRRAEVFEKIGNYVLNSISYTQITSGVRTIDDFLKKHREFIDESIEVLIQNPDSGVLNLIPAKNSMSFSTPAGIGAEEIQTRETYGRFLVFLVHDLLKEGIFGPKTYSKVRIDGERDPEVELYLGMLFAIQGHQPGRHCFQDPDLDMKFSLAENHQLAKAYLENKPAPGPERVAYCKKVADSARHCGQQIDRGIVECPVKSFKEDTVNCEADFPHSLEATEFMFLVLDGLDKLGKKEFAQEVYTTYGTWPFQILPHGRQGFHFFDAFEENQCLECDQVPVGCDFMSSHLDEIARGFYRSHPCPEKGDGEAYFQERRRQFKARKTTGVEDLGIEELADFNVADDTDGDPN